MSAFIYISYSVELLILLAAHLTFFSVKARILHCLITSYCCVLTNLSVLRIHSILGFPLLIFPSLANYSTKYHGVVLLLFYFFLFIYNFPELCFFLHFSENVFIHFCNTTNLERQIVIQYFKCFRPSRLDL